MKKILTIAFATVFVGIAATSFAATQLTFTMTVTVFAEEVGITGLPSDPADYGALGIKQHKLSDLGADSNAPYYQVINEGWANLQYSLAQTATPAGWSIIENGEAGNVTADNAYRLSALFVGFDRELNLDTDFDSNDVITVAAKQATDHNINPDVVFGSPADSGNAAWTYGYDVPTETGTFQGTRTIRYCLDTPETVSGNGLLEQTLTVTVSAAAL